MASWVKRIEMGTMVGHMISLMPYVMPTHVNSGLQYYQWRLEEPIGVLLAEFLLDSLQGPPIAHLSWK